MPISIFKEEEEIFPKNGNISEPIKLRYNEYFMKLEEYSLKRLRKSKF